MKRLVSIAQVGTDEVDDAFALLNRFFREEGFETPVEELRTNLQSLLADETSAVFLAQQDVKFVGVATVTTSTGLEYGRSAELEDLYVLPEIRKEGVASALIEAVCNWCRSMGVLVVLVTITPHGDQEHNLLDYYRRRGFINKGRKIWSAGYKNGEIIRRIELP